MKTMKYILFVISAVLLAGLFSFKNVDNQFLPTKLRITVIDGLGNPTEGATVSIFEKEEDYRAGDNAVATMSSDSKGRVTFKDLKPVSYYIYAHKGDMNNNGEGVVTAPLDEGKLNKVNTVIE
ncbi:carboxypeptidase-like regulatory domain-containing protein [Marinoscillum pacificum]|uniref:carboxypeptidase-like regulatory domain-containing protein n=1 Tax=Marinoscillum pacificum TaxID=392723 RepID=UPI00215743F2|nr:SpaA isopeptide-forming pilin-related protein [Marinoscillum pacificum]